MFKLKNKNKILVKVFVVLIFAFISTQLLVLNKVGTQGNKLSQVRAAQEEVQLENEIITARIRKLQSRTEVLKTIEQLQMNSASIHYIDANSRSRTALSN